ncbi:DUF6894 family protein [Devosia sp. CN2-171]|uniref:DUF6894 family protein n=1 Tax=Devosia sp. CN2-171 TaxID=3400909 RepID=UPI003BF8B136
MRYFLDISDGPRFFRDDTGQDHPSVSSAFREATTALAEMARDILPDDGTSYDMSVAVRDHHGSPLFTVSLSFRLQVANGDDTEFAADLGLRR